MSPTLQSIELRGGCVCSLAVSVIEASHVVVAVPAASLVMSASSSGRIAPDMIWLSRAPAEASSMASTLMWYGPPGYTDTLGGKSRTAAYTVVAFDAAGNTSAPAEAAYADATTSEDEPAQAEPSPDS